MGFIEDELQEVRKLCEHLVPGSRLISCVQAMVRVEIKLTKVKNIVICIQFPGGYPTDSLLLELKSKTLSQNLLKKLTGVCENEIRTKFIGKPQVLKTIQFVNCFLEENPLSCCYDEITQVKSQLGPNDELKLKQKLSGLSLKVVEGLYIIKAKIGVPHDYPDNAVLLEVESNLPSALDRYIRAQAREEGRQCVEPPLFKPRSKKGPPPPPWEPKPSLLPVVSHLLRQARFLPQQSCLVCSRHCLPPDPQTAVTDESADDHVERIYCGHLAHHKCLIEYMKTPPFQGGKKCKTCGQKIFHDKWRVSDRLAEDRWAHQEARSRELDEVTDFFK